MNTRTVVAWGSVVLSVALIGVGGVASRTDVVGYILEGGLIVIPGLLAFSIIGALVTIRAPGNIVGPLLLGIGVTGTASAVAADSWIGADPPLPGRGWAALIATVGNIGWIASLTLVLFRFPDGNPLTLSWRTVERLSIAAYAIVMCTLALSPGFADYPGIPNPVGVPQGAAASALDGIGGWVFVVSIAAFPAAGLAFIQRFRRSQGEERGRLTWLALGASLIGFGSLFLSSSFFLFGSKPDEHPIGQLFFLPFLIGLLIFPVAAGIGILRHRLFDIDLVIRKTVVYGILVALILGVAGLGGLLLGGLVIRPKDPSPGLLLLLGAVGGLLLWPLRRLATRIAERVVFRGRPSPYEVLTEFSDRMSVSYASDDVLPRLAAVLGEGTGAARAVVWLRITNELRAEAVWPSDARTPSDPPEGKVEVIHQGELLGALSVEMPANDPMNPTKEKIVRDLAGQAGLVLRNVRLIEELRESRRRIVAAQDERAKKLERDIHDGAQQQLVALAVKQRLAASLMGRDDERARAMLDELQRETNDALEDLRDLARGIYPPLLADQGLAAALEAQARKSPIPVTVDSVGIGRYPQEVESAVYFSVLEALQNVAKYAEAGHATVRLAESNGDLSFEVADDGVGFNTATVARGTGLQGLTDRLAALDGSLALESSEGEGTRVSGKVPTKAREVTP